MGSICVVRGQALTPAATTSGDWSPAYGFMTVSNGGETIQDTANAGQPVYTVVSSPELGALSGTFVVDVSSTPPSDTAYRILEVRSGGTTIASSPQFYIYRDGAVETTQVVIPFTTALPEGVTSMVLTTGPTTYGTYELV